MSLAYSRTLLFVSLGAVVFNEVVSFPLGLNPVDVISIVLLLAALTLYGTRLPIPCRSRGALLFIFGGGVYYCVLAIVFILTQDNHINDFGTFAPNVRYLLAGAFVLGIMMLARRETDPDSFLLKASIVVFAPHFIVAIQQAATVYIGIGSPDDWLYMPVRREGTDLTWSVAGITNAQFSLSSISLFFSAMALAAICSSRDYMVRRNIPALLLLFMASLCIILSGRRAQTIALLLILFATFTIRPQELIKPKKLGVVFIPVILSCILIIFLIYWMSQFTDRFTLVVSAFRHGGLEHEVSSFAVRVQQVGEYLSLIAEYPLGTMLFPSHFGVFNGDNSFLAQWLWGGFPGLVFYVGVFVLFFYHAVRSYSRSNNQSERFMALFMILLTVAFVVRAAGGGGGLQVPDSFLYWFAVGLFLGTKSRRFREVRTKTKPLAHNNVFVVESK